MDELAALFKKYKITIHTIGLNDTIYLERFGIIMPFNEAWICNLRPKKVCAEILKKFIQHPDYKKKTAKYIKSLSKRPLVIKSTTLTVDDKKKLIRRKLIKEGLIN